MFTKQDLLLIGQTLTQRRNWLAKQPSEADSSVIQTLKHLDTLIGRISAELKQSSAKAGDPLNHYISPKATSIKETAIQRRRNLSAEQIRVLIVDDDQLICELLNVYLRDMGITLIETATDGLMAISLIYDANPVFDLVLCDWNMPVKSGIDVHKAMHAAERYNASVFMLVTAIAEAKQIRAAIESGIDDYVIKPIEQDKLRAKMANYFPKLATPQE